MYIVNSKAHLLRIAFLRQNTFNCYWLFQEMCIFKYRTHTLFSNKLLRLTVFLPTPVLHSIDNNMLLPFNKSAKFSNTFNTFQIPNVRDIETFNKIDNDYFFLIFIFMYQHSTIGYIVCFIRDTHISKT